MDRTYGSDPYFFFILNFTEFFVRIVCLEEAKDHLIVCFIFRSQVSEALMHLTTDLDTFHSHTEPSPHFIHNNLQLFLSLQGIHFLGIRLVFQGFHVYLL